MNHFFLLLQLFIVEVLELLGVSIVNYNKNEYHNIHGFNIKGEVV